jgi:hypothetical protein
MAFTYTAQNVQEKPAFKIAPVGEYDIEIIKAEEKISKSGKDMIVLTLKIRHPEYSNEFFEHIVDGEYVQQRIHDILTACGTAPQRGQAITGQTFLGKTAKVAIKHEDYNGTPQIKVKFWKRKSANAVPQSENLIDVPADDKTLDQIPF